MKRKSQFGSRSSELRLLGWTLLSAALIALTAPVGIAADDESAGKLPQDGAWVRYEEQWERRDNGAKTVRKITLSFVGRVIEKDEPCQWIEIKIVVPEGDEAQGTWIEKFLVRQKDLLESSNPLENVIRAWRKHDDEAPYVSPVYQRHDLGYGLLLLWTPGVLNDADSPNQAKNVEYQKGRLKGAKPRTGRQMLSIQDAAGRIEFTHSRKYTAWQHASLPIGFAGAEIVDEVLDADQKVRSVQSTAYLLEDAGKGAKSELPDNN